MVKQISTLAILLVVFIFLVYIYYFAIDFPFQDDLLLLDFVELVDTGTLTFSTFFKELFKTYNDHKVVTPRLISLIDFKINGYLNFKTYIGLISLNLLYMLYFLYAQFKKTLLPIFYFLPVPLLFLQPQFHDVSIWAINGMQHSFLTVFLISAIFSIARGGKTGFYGAVVFCFLATFTHGNGILSFPAIIFFLLCTKKYKDAIGFTIFMFIALGLYLAGYETGQAAGLPPTVSVFIFSLLGFIGASMSEWDNYIIHSVLWGGVITAFVVMLVFKIIKVSIVKNEEVKPAINIELLTLFAFIFITSFVIAIFRSWQGVTLTSRFQLYAALSSCIFYLLLLNYSRIFRSRNALIIITFLSVVYWAHSYYRYTDVVANKRTRYLADIYNWRYDKLLFTIEKSMQENAAFYLIPAYKKGVFRLPEPPISKNELDALIAANQQNKSDVVVGLTKQVSERIDRKDIVSDTLYHLVNETVPKSKALLSDRYIVLRSKQTQLNYLLCANPERQGRKDVLLMKGYYKNGFFCFLQKLNIPSGEYQIGLLDIDSGGGKEFSLFKDVLAVKDMKLSLNRD